MPAVETIIIGAGQAGLALSRLLSERGRDHVILERGRIGERWRNERWDSLRLLTPNWMTRLPGWAYHGPDPDGFMAASELVDVFERYAWSFGAPVRAETTVESVRCRGDGYLVLTDQGSWTARNIVVATGAAQEVRVPDVARELDPNLHRVLPTRYRDPADLPAGGVLVVGASSTGVQLADEIAASGRRVVLSVGRHTRAVRRHRGRDLFWWLERTGTLDRTLDDVGDAPRLLHEPSLQLTGRTRGGNLDLAALRRRGVTLAGHLVGTAGTRVGFADDLARTTADADRRLRRLLRRCDEWARRHRLDAHLPEAAPLAPIDPTGAPLELDLGAAGIETVLWATGYGRSYPWLHVPVLGRSGEIVHHGGVTPSPGLYVLGMKFQRSRRSTFIDGARHDAAAVAEHIASRSRRVAVAV